MPNTTNDSKRGRRASGRGRAKADGQDGSAQLMAGNAPADDQTSAAAMDRDDRRGLAQAAERAYGSALAKRAGGQL